MSDSTDQTFGSSKNQFLTLFLFVGLGMGFLFVLTEQQSVVDWQEKSYQKWLESQMNDKHGESKP